VRVILTVEMVGQFCVRSHVITCLFQLLYKVFYGISICIICNTDGVSDYTEIRYPVKLKVPYNLLCF